jgi:hypothetical protein
MICTATTSDKALASRFRSTALKMSSALERMSVMGRRWEDVLREFEGVESSITELENYIASNLSKEDAKYYLTRLIGMDKRFGIKYVSSRLLNKIKINNHSIVYLQVLFSHLNKSDLSTPKIEETYSYILQVLKSINQKESDNISLDEVTTFIQTLRYIQESITLRSGEMFIK